jgi:short-subunit dehydrogenase
MALPPPSQGSTALVTGASAGIGIGIARAAVDGAERGKRVVVPGLMNRAGALTGQHSPRMLALPLVKRVWRSAT